MVESHRTLTSVPHPCSAVSNRVAEIDRPGDAVAHPSVQRQRLVARCATRHTAANDQVPHA
eukprot:6562606-Prymnesium_polylepis.1